MGFWTRKNISLQLLFISGAFLSGCAHAPSSPFNQDGDVPAPKSLTDLLQQDINQPVAAPAVVVRDGELVVQGIRLKNTKFDLPITINSRVENWITYFTGKGRVYFAKYLERSEFFIPYIAPLLKQNGLPEDLVYLAMIESGFNNLARSSARAVGPWQFMPTTGKRYGLKVNWWVDQRRDIEKSTLSAVGFLKDLYLIFNNWELAAAAYNAGEAKIARGVRRYGTKDFWTISRSRFLHHETRDYVPKIIAAAIIAKNREQFGFTQKEPKPAADEAVAGDGEIVKVIKSDSINPREENEYKEDVKAAMLDEEEDESDASPEDISKLVVRAENSATPDQPLAKPVATPHLTKKGEVGGEELAEFDVQSPADLLKIARAAGLSYQTVKSLNPEVLRWCTPPTMGIYRIKLPSSVREKFLSTYNHQAFPRKVQFMTYKVKKGETLSKIAKHFGIKVDPMSDLNRMSAKSPLQFGSQILLPMPNDRSRTFASLEVFDLPEKSRRHHRRHHHRRTSSRSYKITYRHREAARAVGTRGASHRREG